MTSYSHQKYSVNEYKMNMCCILSFPLKSTINIHLASCIETNEFYMIILKLTFSLVLRPFMNIIDMKKALFRHSESIVQRPDTQK